MTLRVSGKGMDIGDSLRHYAEGKILAIVAKYFDNHVRGHVIFCPEGAGYRVESVLHMPTGITLQAEGKGQEPYGSFDKSAERIERQVRRHKERIKQRSSGQMAGDDRALAHYVIESRQNTEESLETDPVVIAETRMPIEFLSVAEAVHELDASGAPFILFYHSGTSRVNIVYRRTDGHVSWMDPPRADIEH